MMKSALFRLLLKHQRIDAMIQSEQARRWPDPLRIRMLKKMKLAIKDRLHRAAQGRKAFSA